MHLHLAYFPATARAPMHRAPWRWVYMVHCRCVDTKHVLHQSTCCPDTATCDLRLMSDGYTPMPDPSNQRDIKSLAAPVYLLYDARCCHQHSPYYQERVSGGTPTRRMGLSGQGPQGLTLHCEPSLGHLQTQPHHPPLACNLFPPRRCNLSTFQPWINL